MDKLSTLGLFRRAHTIVKDDAVLAPAFRKYQRDAKKITRPISVDLTSRCNLFCEGCYYFEGENKIFRDEEDDQKWVDFFKLQKELKIQYCYLGGAEPALPSERLRLAAEAIPFGIIATNGTIKIDRSIPYKIVVSVWGDEELTGRLRGGKTFWKALRNFGTDPRAHFAYTLTRENIDQVRSVADIMKDSGAKLTFNMYSPTSTYLDKIANNVSNDSEFFRISSKSDNLCFTPDDLIRCRETIAEVIDDFPETVVYPHEYNREVTSDVGLYDLDSVSHIATNCAGRHNGTHSTYLSTLEGSQEKCCMPNIDCEDCRALASYLPSRLMLKPKDVVSRESMKNWLEISHYWAWFYLGEPWAPLESQQRKIGKPESIRNPGTLIASDSFAV